MWQVSLSELRGKFAELGNMVSGDGHRIIVTRRGKPWLALVHVEDAQYLEAREDAIDLREAKKALAEGGENITLEELKRELRW
ncbi:MAG: type II toxin-antitoxin system Phd/YefM family antitoxin [Desulfarculus sp.]|nr:type II toxin-antitoxin system Phd/YefM family antitoxin [Desulfarculus sp.]